MKEKIIIFGASTAGKVCYELLKNKYEILYFVDNNQELTGNKLNDILIISPHELIEVSNKIDKIVVASQYYKEIIDQLNELNINKPIETMKISFTNEVLIEYENKDVLSKYLSGEALNTSLKINYKNIGIYKPRTEVLKELLREKSVIDLGFADHVDVIRSKLINDEWLHKMVCDVSSNCIGIDINKHAVEYVKSLGFENVLHADIINDSIDILNKQTWDVLLMAEIIEHINNPVDFLHKIKCKYGANIKEYIITVPNAFSRKNLIFANENIERINTDHRYWFSPYTLMKVVHEAGLKTKQLIMCGLTVQKSADIESLTMPTIVLIAE